MANEPQNFSNHTRFDPPFHFFILPVFAITLIAVIVHVVRRPSIHSAWMIVFILAAIAAIFKIRLYALKVQDRVIRLEERQRLGVLLSEPLRSRIGSLTEQQLIGLRFASDGEVAGLVQAALDENLSGEAIKKRVQSWRPDFFRV